MVLRCGFDACVEVMVHQGASVSEETHHVVIRSKQGKRSHWPVSSNNFSGRMALAALRFSSVLSEHPFTLEKGRQEQLSTNDDSIIYLTWNPMSIWWRKISNCNNNVLTIINLLTISFTSSTVPVKLWTTPPLAPTAFPPSSPKPSSRRIFTKSACAAREWRKSGRWCFFASASCEPVD